MLSHIPKTEFKKSRITLIITDNQFVLVSGSEIREAESMLNEIVSSKISKTDFQMYQQHLKNQMGIENLFSDIDSESDQRHSVH